MAANISEPLVNVQDLSQKSEFISQGPPVRYRLLTNRSNLDEKVRKWTFGQRYNYMENKIILLVGETGTGKTTLINVMVNYILGVKYEDEVWFEITQEGGDNDVRDQSNSQTTQITVYEVFAQDNPMCLTVIDTPGYGDTRGTHMDKEIAENLCKLFHSDNGVKEIDAVCLVVKASDNRLSDRQLYISDAVLSLFGKDIENNIVIFATHSDGSPPTNVINTVKKAGIRCRKDKENEPDYFLFSNRQTEKRSEKSKRSQQSAWEQTGESLQMFLGSLKEENRKSLGQTESVLTESKRLEACIINLQSRIECEEYKAEELTQIQRALTQNRERIRNKENFTFTVIKYYKEKVPIKAAARNDRKATTCTVCQENCHEYGCSMTPNSLWCEVIKLNYCTSCTKKCHFSKHVRESKKYVTKSRNVTMTYNELKWQFGIHDDSELDSSTFANIVNGLQKNRKQLQECLNMDLNKAKKEKASLVEEACSTVIKLSEIALKPDSAFIVKYLDFLVSRAKDVGRDFLAQQMDKLRKLWSESKERANSVTRYRN